MSWIWMLPSKVITSAWATTRQRVCFHWCAIQDFKNTHNSLIDQMSCPVWIKNNLNYYKEKQTCVVQRLNVRWLLTKMTDHSSATSFLEFSVLFPQDLDLHTVSKWLTDRSAFMAKFTNPYQFWMWREPSLLVYKILFAFLSFPKCRSCWSTKPLAL